MNEHIWNEVNLKKHRRSWQGTDTQHDTEVRFVTFTDIKTQELLEHLFTLALTLLGVSSINLKCNFSRSLLGQWGQMGLGNPLLFKMGNDKNKFENHSHTQLWKPKNI